MRLGEAEADVRSGDCVLIAPGAAHKLWNTGDEPLVLLCCCVPPYSDDDTVLDRAVSALSKRDRLLIAVVVVLTALAALCRYLSGLPEILAFIVAALALAGQAAIVSNATEDVGEVVGPAITGTLQSTVGNLPEFFVVIFAPAGR